MNIDLADTIDRFSAAATLETLERAFMSYIEGLGFSTFTYAGLRNPGSNDGQRLVLTNYPAEWIGRYEAERYETIDPVLAASAQKVTPVIWSDLLRKDVIKPDQRRVLNEATHFGLLTGLTVPIHGPNGSFAILSVAANACDGLVNGALDLRNHALHVASLHFHEQAWARAAPLANDQSPHLSRREKESLLWSARGKSAWEISEILGISEHTATQYIKSAMYKLGVHSKPHAVVRAVMQYLIYP